MHSRDDGNGIFPAEVGVVKSVDNAPVSRDSLIVRSLHLVEKPGEVEAPLVDPEDFHIYIVGAVLCHLESDRRIDISLISGQDAPVVVIRTADPDS